VSLLDYYVLITLVEKKFFSLTDLHSMSFLLGSIPFMFLAFTESFITSFYFSSDYGTGDTSLADYLCSLLIIDNGTS